MSDDLISRKALMKAMKEIRLDNIKDVKAWIEAELLIERAPAIFDKEKVIEELKSWAKASHDAGIRSSYADLNSKAREYYQESRAYYRAVEIVKKGGI